MAAEAHIVEGRGVDLRPLASSHNVVDVATAGASDSCVRVLLLKYRELAAKRLHLLSDLLFLQLRRRCREDIVSIRLHRLLLHIGHTPNGVQLLQRELIRPI